MEELLNALAVRAGSMDAQMGQPRWGIVQSFDPTRYMARITLQPENVLTGWLPIVSPTYGPGWGVVSPLEPGQQVLCIPDNGDHDNPCILGGTWNTQATVPKIPSSITGQPNNLQSGEWAFVSPQGSYLRFCADGSVLLSATALYMLAQTIYSLGSGSSTPQRLATETFVLDVYNNHTHGGIQPGGGNTAVPNQQAGSSDLTTNLKAS
jgi:Type VI secretion system/phage-baseplate injector OB domain/GpV Apex motif